MLEIAIVVLSQTSLLIINFLDLKISIKDGKVHTDLYRKPTDKPRALLPSSAHPTHITTNIVFSMAFRLLRICSNEGLFETRLKELKKEFLIPRGYKSQIIEGQFKKVKNLPGNTFSEKRREALKKKEKTETNVNRIIAPFNYNPLLPKISTVLVKHYTAMIFNNPELQKVFPEPPMAALRQGPNLKKYLCRAKLSKISRNKKLPRNSHKNAAGWK